MKSRAEGLSGGGEWTAREINQAAVSRRAVRRPSFVGDPGMASAKGSGYLLSGQGPLEVQREDARVRPQLEAF